MSNKKNRNTKGRIIDAAWKLFYRKGYDDTTIDEIIDESETSRGSFYHYFKGKDSLLSSLSYLFDEKYTELEKSLKDEKGSFEKLMFLNSELFGYIEKNISVDLLARLYSSQLITKGCRHLLDYNRIYYKLLQKIVVEGQEKGELCTNVTADEIVKTYALCERALIYDWCMHDGEYSLKSYSEQKMPVFLSGYKKI
ncbi:MAG: TetR/AcrR family transcriptional regulator [Bacillota bacterium]|nr:TetR/AcrR family transcriptional regulator [Bacillota bacterium]